MWWLIATLGLVAIVAGLGGVWSLQCELRRVAAERDVFDLQNENLRELAARRARELVFFRALVRDAMPMVHAFADASGATPESWQRIRWFRRVPFNIGREASDAKTHDDGDARARSSDGRA